MVELDGAGRYTVSFVHGLEELCDAVQRSAAMLGMRLPLSCMLYRLCEYVEVSILIAIGGAGCVH